LRRCDDLAAILRDALIFESDSPMNEEHLLKQTQGLLESLNEGKIPHVLVGGLALLQYVDVRNTRDIDLILATEDLPRLPGFVLREKNEWFATGDCGPLRVDLLLTANPFFAEVATKHSRPRRFLDTTLHCATPEGIILLKLYALPSLYRQGSVTRADLYETDILQLLRIDSIADDTLLAQLRPHVSETDLNALSGVLTDIRGRLTAQDRFV
jgi:hypothetical protein